MYNKPLIVFEGIEVSGKTTNIRIVSKLLRRLKKDHIKFREPGGSKYSEVIRKLILNNKSKTNYITDLLLILASRSENIENIIKKNYRKKIILIDRFVDSTVAYQHYGMNIDISLIKKMNDFITNKLKPDLTILSLVNEKNFKKRLNSRKNNNKYDKFNFSFYNKVQKGYIKIAKGDNRYLIIDSNKNTIKQNSDIIINSINKLI